MIFFILIVENVGLAAVPPCVWIAGWLFGGMDSKPVMAELQYLIFNNPNFKNFFQCHLKRFVVWVD